MTEPLKYYYRNFTEKKELPKEEAVSASRDKLIDVLTRVLDLPGGNGVFILVDSQGSEIIFWHDWSPWDESKTPPEDPVFAIEVPYFYEGRESNVSFIKTERAWGPKPIRVYLRYAKLSELAGIIKALPDVFSQACVPESKLDRSEYYRD